MIMDDEKYEAELYSSQGSMFHIDIIYYLMHENTKTLKIRKFKINRKPHRLLETGDRR
jgi:hypothetical protein